MNTYYNTTKENGNQLLMFVEKAKSQDERILLLMRKNKEQTPSELIKHFENTPITSIRRSLTNLTKQGKLTKTDNKKIGLYGRFEYVWLINE